MAAIKERPEQTLMKSQLDKIYGTIQEATAAYNQQYVHTDTLWEQLHSNRMDTNDKSQAVQLLQTNWNKMLDKLYETSYNYCRENNLSYKLPMIVFKEYIKIMKDNISA